MHYLYTEAISALQKQDVFLGQAISETEKQIVMCENRREFLEGNLKDMRRRHEEVIRASNHLKEMDKPPNPQEVFNRPIPYVDVFDRALKSNATVKS